MPVPYAPFSGYYTYMNKLFKKLKEFGLIMAQSLETEDQVINFSKGLKQADLPVALFDCRKKNKLDCLKISSENEDMFLGAFCPPSEDMIKKSISSGAHFIVTDQFDGKISEFCFNNGYDLITQITNIQDALEAEKWGTGAILIDASKKNNLTLIDNVLEATELTVFLMGNKDTIPFDLYRNSGKVCAFIIENYFNDNEITMVGYRPIIEKTNTLIRDFLCLNYKCLFIKEDSDRLNDAETFAALSSIPIYRNVEKNCLVMETKDMDRTIAHLKWKNIYMDPLSAKMRDSRILETELYSDLMGCIIKLIDIS